MSDSFKQGFTETLQFFETLYWRLIPNNYAIIKNITIAK